MQDAGVDLRGMKGTRFFGQNFPKSAQKRLFFYKFAVLGLK